ncbi:MAG: hypothetical protein F6K19_35725 [Cyanothece sp. SIO1E1]|nr:hypothetical protein [Cyanothece sp. SIO1E1]
MLKQVYTLGLLSIAALGVTALPAQADTAVIQSTTQETYIEGVYNGSAQVNEQINLNRSVNVRGRNGSTGIVQDTYQGTVVIGEDNTAVQSGSQINITEEVNRSRRGSRRRAPIYIEQR